MARMIPPRVGEKTVSPGEIWLFDKFKKDQETGDWIVLHSMGCAEHSERLSGEIDLVVIIPGVGVLCIEVKASTGVRREEGDWFFSEGNKWIKRISPFKQVEDSTYSFKKALVKSDWSLKGLLFYHSVMFTKNNFSEDSPEWHQWQSVNKTMLYRKPISSICLNIMEEAHQLVSKTPSCGWYDKKESRPTKEQVESIISIARGDFEYILSPSDDLADSEEEIHKYTEEQYHILDLYEANDRLLITGPAGTGKTYIALEAVRRSVAKKKRTLFLCFNRLLSDWVDEVLIDTDKSGYVEHYSIHKFLEKYTPQPISRKSKDQEYFDKTLPNAFIDQFLEDEIDLDLFDCLVVDEIQDLMKVEYLDVMDTLLSGGLAAGKWLFLGDPEYQVIFDNCIRFNDEMKTIIQQRVNNHYTSYPLRINCRNERTIALGIESVCGMNPGYSKYLYGEGGSHLSTKGYSNIADQKKQLKELLVDYIRDFGAENIVILSTKEDRKSTAGKLYYSGESKNIYPINQNREKGMVRFCSAQKFKGLESPIVIFTDIDSISTEYKRSVLYVGMTRAKYKLVVFVSNSCADNWKDLVINNYKI